jgi:outer membrane lipoprotein-sorting protein
MIKKIFFLIFFACLLGFTNSVAQTVSEIAKAMFAKTKTIKTLTYTMKKIERIHGKPFLQESKVKLHLDPLKVYLHQNIPKYGIEVLYVSGTNNNHALVNPNGFPWFSINLDPYGSTMRENQHHTLLNSGYDHVVSILEHLYVKYSAQIESMTKIEGSIVWENNNCWIVSLTNPYFKYVNYTAQKGETLLTIANKFKLSEHMMMEKNPSVRSYTESLAGKTLSIPNDYSSKMILYIDKVRMIPLLMKVYDNEGLYEHYEYLNMVINPVIKPEEFQSNYEDYHF